MRKEKPAYLLPLISIMNIHGQSVLCQSGNSLEDWNVEEQDIFNN